MEKRKENVERKIDKRKEKEEKKRFKKDMKKKEEQEEGLHCEGIYRLSGVKSKAHQLRRLYNTGEGVRLCDQEPHVIASLLKQYLRELPEPVLTSDMMPHFEDVAMIPNPGERAEAMRQLINRLPTANTCSSIWDTSLQGELPEPVMPSDMMPHFEDVAMIPNPGERAEAMRQLINRLPTANTCSSIWDTSLQGELPEPVLTSDMMPHFEDVAMIPNPGERAEAMRQLINRLPTANRLLLQYMFKHMGHIIARVPEDAFPWTAAGDILLRGWRPSSFV
ncbi:rho GTPase-activating protein gacQ-like [Eriocheir sinensis]|uniref:rho GTPase-activating protein gacQ-like n=1 Tax=Eriocheir sinensis TaxID=95602 RepID=UPI0021C8484A|nr:rho GTPase-activating protein gacQ-like [Eriocheir sinensis]XP_050707914.1 rho GTPase-activating protein gacQ-like [Eriocheir sinensis]